MGRGRPKKVSLSTSQSQSAEPDQQAKQSNEDEEIIVETPKTKIREKTIEAAELITTKEPTGKMDKKAT